MRRTFDDIWHTGERSWKQIVTEYPTILFGLGLMQLIMLSSTSNLTISLGIAKLQAENSTDFGLIMAGAALAAASAMC